MEDLTEAREALLRLREILISWRDDPVWFAREDPVAALVVRRAERRGTVIIRL